MDVFIDVMQEFIGFKSFSNEGEKKLEEHVELCMLENSTYQNEIAWDVKYQALIEYKASHNEKDPGQAYKDEIVIKNGKWKDEKVKKGVGKSRFQQRTIKN